MTTQFVNAVSWIQQHSAACSFRFSSPLTRFLKDKFGVEIILQSAKVKLWLQWDDGASLFCCCCCNDNDGKDDDYNDAEDNNFEENSKFLKIFVLVFPVRQIQGRRRCTWPHPKASWTAQRSWCRPEQMCPPKTVWDTLRWIWRASGAAGRLQGDESKEEFTARWKFAWNVLFFF